MKKGSDDSFEELLQQNLLRAGGQGGKDCPDENFISGYLDGELPESLKSSFEEHAASCRRCQQELSMAVRAWEGPVNATQNSRRHLAEPKSSGWVSWLRSFPGWLNTPALKPVLTVLTVGLVTGTLGYFVYQESHRSGQEEAQVAYDQPAPDNRPDPHSRVSELESREELKAASSADKPEEVGEGRDYFASKERQLLTKEKSKKVSTPAARQPLRSVGKLAKQEAASPKDARRDLSFRADLKESPRPGQKRNHATGGEGLPPASAAVGQSRMANARGLATTESPAANVIARPNEPQSPGRKSLESLSGFSPVPPESSAVESKSKKSASGIVRTLEKPELEQDQSSPALRGGEGGAMPDRSQETRTAFRKKLADDEAPRTLRVAGKVFQLQDGTWTEESIRLDELPGATVIQKNSDRYEEQTKELSAYQMLLSQPEDCLIRQGETVYWIKGSPAAARQGVRER